MPAPASSVPHPEPDRDERQAESGDPTRIAARDLRGEARLTHALEQRNEELSNALARLRASEEQLQAIIRTEPECVKLVSADGRLLEMNPAGLAMIEADSIEQVRGGPLLSLVAPECRDAFAQLHGQVLAGVAGTLTFEMIGLRGTRRWLETHAVPLRLEGGLTALLAITRDITARREQDSRIARLSRMRSVLVAVSSMLLRARDRRTVLDAACRIAAREGDLPLALGCMVEPETGTADVVARHGGEFGFVDRLVISAGSSASAHGDRPGSRALRSRRIAVSRDVMQDDSLVPLRAELEAAGIRSVAACPIVVDGKAVAVIILCARTVDYFDADERSLLEVMAVDVSFAFDRLAKAERLDFLAWYDGLTGLPNHALFLRRLEQSLGAARRANQHLCTILLDIEHFTHINDTMGREAGDELLQGVAARLAEHLGASWCLARTGADSFAAASLCADEDAHSGLRDRILSALSLPFMVGERSVVVSAQLGIALYPADGEDPATLFQHAEAAMRQAKTSGVRCLYYAREVNERIARRLGLELELREAVERQQFVLHYQPRAELANGGIVGAEALIRWQHPTRGLLPPGDFIAFAEETGLIEPIGEWVIGAVCAQQAAWIAAGVPTVPIALNVSPLQLRRGDLALRIENALLVHGLGADQLDIELTETAVMHDPEAAGLALRALRKVGVGLALDDFGTGYSSLAHLKRFPFGSVKIDRAFVTDVTRSADDAAIATAIISMSHRLGLKVVAEGVETAGQVSFFRAQGCNEMQGNYFSPAVAADAFETLLRSARRLSLPGPATSGANTVLVVDDEPGIRAAINRTLRRDGYRVLLAASGHDALDLLAGNDVQVVISDQRMAVMSGTAFLKIVSQLYPSTQRIVLSGYTDLATVTEAVNAGSVFRVLTKPWDDDDLREQVREGFRRYKTGADDAASPDEAIAT